MNTPFQSSSPHTEIREKLQNMFPHIHLPFATSSSSLSDSLNQIIKSIPRPPNHERMQAINHMKSFVDKQELRIQINMMELDEIEPLPLHQISKKCSFETQDDDSWEDRPVHDPANWGWQCEDIHYQESIHNDFPSFID